MCREKIGAIINHLNIPTFFHDLALGLQFGWNPEDGKPNAGPVAATMVHSLPVFGVSLLPSMQHSRPKTRSQGSRSSTSATPSLPSFPIIQPFHTDHVASDVSETAVQHHAECRNWTCDRYSLIPQALCGMCTFQDRKPPFER